MKFNISTKGLVVPIKLSVYLLMPNLYQEVD
jgi:hypothetical protein